MKAIALRPGSGSLRLVDGPEPEVKEPDEVKLKVIEVGICGTDREEARGGRAAAPPGEDELIIGHEMIGRIVETGAGVSPVKPGDLAILTVRRGCGHCPACDLHRSDMCYTGDYADRGIKGRDGYQAEYVVDHERYALKVPEAIAGIGVLAEPMSIAQKAIDEAVTIQRDRLPDVVDGDRWLEGQRVLVAGLGPVGLLAAIALRLRGANVLGLDIVDRTGLRARLLEAIGGRYVDGRGASPEELGEHFGRAALIFEATGIARLEFDLLSTLGRNGLYVLTGLPGGDRPINIHGAPLVRGLVLGNQLMVGSVNASRAHFSQGIADLAAARERWGDTVDRMITHRFPHTKFNAALTQHLSGEIKAVVEWRAPAERRSPSVPADDRASS